MNKNILYYLWLAESFSYGSVKPIQIATNVTDWNDFYENIYEKADEYGLTDKQLKRLRKSVPSDYLKIVNKCKKLNISITCFDDENYPEKLKHIESAPLVLYYVGDISVVNKPSVAVVGTRKADSYGLGVAKKIAEDLVNCGITVVSGCAEGIDMRAHVGAIGREGKTIAVLGTSLEKDYPSGSGKLKRSIIDCGGAVVSEYAPGTDTAPWLFPVRNRLIVGMSDSVVVVQSPKKSGAMITAGIACEYGKEVFCVPPSNIFDSKNDGIKKCLRDGANLLLDIDDILETYRFSNYIVPKNVAKKDILKTNELLENKISNIPIHLEKLFESVDINKDLDQLSEELKISIDKLLPMLTELEIMGFIEKSGLNYKKT